MNLKLYGHNYTLYIIAMLIQILIIVVHNDMSHAYIIVKLEVFTLVITLMKDLSKDLQLPVQPITTIMIPLLLILKTYVLQSWQI